MDTNAPPLVLLLPRIPHRHKTKLHPLQSGLEGRALSRPRGRGREDVYNPNWFSPAVTLRSWQLPEAGSIERMKQLLQLTALAVAVSSLAISSAPAQAKKNETKKMEANQAAGQPKISKADAERLVMQRNPGANVLNVTQATVGGHQVWAVSVAGTGAPAPKKIYVDQDSGKLSY
jgi:hypothetical protein